jgi:hypothetical protein
MRATELPTVPKPKMAMRKWCALRGLRGGGADASNGNAELSTSGK